MVKIFYAALVKKVELLRDGRLMHQDASELAKGGWTYQMTHQDRIRGIAEAVAIERVLTSTEYERTSTAEGISFHNQSSRKPLLCSFDIARRLRADECVYNIAEPSELMQKPFESNST